MSKTVAEILDHLVLEPEELLIVRISPRTSMEWVGNLREQLDTYSFGNRVVIVAAEQIEAVSLADEREIKINFGSLPPHVADKAEQRLRDAFNKAAGQL